MKEQFIEKSFHQKTLGIIKSANDIIDEYLANGFRLTVRQLYYQFVSRDLIENNMKSYKMIVTVINDARLTGLIDWDVIEDRTRYLRKNSAWDNGADIIDSCISGFQKDRWKNQHNRVEVWIEKDALIGVIDKVCRDNDVPYFACRGYASQSEVYVASKRLIHYLNNGQHPVIIHLGDHDPSGLDMTRDNNARLDMFVGIPVEVNRIALNENQVNIYNPPPNPAKTTDSRYNDYQKKYGVESWELDALDPIIISDLIEEEIKKYRDDDILEEILSEEEVIKEELTKVMRDFSDRNI